MASVAKARAKVVNLKIRASRRPFLGAGCALLLVGLDSRLGGRSLASPVEYKREVDCDHGKVALEVPVNWKRASGSVSQSSPNDRSFIIAFTPPEGDSVTSVSIVTTSISVEFNSIGAFGTAENFAQRVVASYGPGAEVLQVSSNLGKSYVVEYRVQDKHIWSQSQVIQNGYYTNLVSISGVCAEDSVSELKEIMQHAVIDSVEVQSC